YPTHRYSEAALRPVGNSKNMPPNPSGIGRPRLRVGRASRPVIFPLLAAGRLRHTSSIALAHPRGGAVAHLSGPTQQFKIALRLRTAQCPEDAGENARQHQVDADHVNSSPPSYRSLRAPQISKGY